MNPIAKKASKAMISSAPETATVPEYGAWIDWTVIKAEIASMPWRYDRYDRCFTRQYYIGTIMSLTPSGCFYVPWSNGNVTEEEADQDTEWWEEHEQGAQAAGLSIGNGEGDPCDIFATEYSDLPDPGYRLDNDQDCPVCDCAIWNGGQSHNPAQCDVCGLWQCLDDYSKTFTHPICAWAILRPTIGG